MASVKDKDPYTALRRLKDSGNLPVIPQLLVQLLDLCRQPEINLQAVGQLIKKDASMAAKVLQLCNSAFIGARSPFLNVEQAVIYLGADTVKNLAVSVSVQQVFRKIEANGLLNMDRFWYHSYQNAILAGRIADAVSYPNASEAYLAGLLHDLGKLVLWMAFPGKYAPLLLKGIRCHDGRLSFLEQEKLHINHCEAGAWLIEQWGLPVLIADAVRYHHHPVDKVEQALPLTRITYLADLISHSDNPEQECNEVAGKLFRLAPGQTEQLKEGVEEQIQEVARQLGIRIPSQNKSTMEPEETASVTVHQQTTKKLENRIRDITQLTGMLDNLLKSPNRRQTALIVEQSLKILFNQPTCLLLLLEKDSRMLRAVTSGENILQAEADSLCFSIDRHQDSLPVNALELQQMMHSFMPRPEKDITTLDSQLIDLLATEGMVIFPMQLHQQKVGLLIIGVNKNEYLELLTHAGPLQLLAAQAGASLYVQDQQNRKIRRITTERLEGAAMLARKIAHEINNPLAILRNYIKVMKVKLKDRKDLHEDLIIMDQEFEQIGRITDQLRDIAVDEAKTDFENINLNQLIADMVTLYNSGFPADGNISLKFHPDPEISRLLTDKNGLRQVMGNLLNNAVEALDGRRGIISVSTTKNRAENGTEEVIIKVTDNGPGIDPQLKRNLFQAGTTSKTGGHSGLGLAISRRIVQQLGGSIFLDTSTEATTFSVILPLAPL